MIETRQIGEGIAALHQDNLTQYQSFLAQPFGSFTMLLLLRCTDLKGDHIPASVRLVLKAL
ncbi:hypothetical protein EYS14_17305 [Alteromonadaceae bacterium M269]|nr:hypothetical protein EYS14_17305 [Alteromonadaceae bacterium M269]